MMRLRFVFVSAVFACSLRAEVRTLTLRQAIDLALKQNPDVIAARLDEQKALQSIRLAKDPFTPRIGVGSGLAYSSGFPMSIDGAAPSIVQARATQFIFNRQQSYIVAEARENARGAGIAASGKRDEIAFKTTSLFLDAERAGRLAQMAQKQIESMEKVTGAVRGRVEEGRELPIANKRAAVDLARARQRLEQLDSDRDFAEHSLALVLGLNADDQIRPADEPRTAPDLPASEEAAVKTALDGSKELRRLESNLIAKGLDVRAQKASRLPRVDLVAQYALFARFNHYEDFFRRFERNNGQLGVSFQIPLLPGPGVSAQVAQAEADAVRLRAEINASRNRISLDTRQSFRSIQKAERAREVARQDLDLARDELSLLLTRMGEGRATLKQVEEARFVEDEKWIAFYDAQYAAERAKWDLLRQTGDLVASLK